MENDDIEMLLTALDARRAEIEAAVKAVETEQAAGRIGLNAYLRAKAASDAYVRLAASVQSRIEGALASL